MRRTIAGKRWLFAGVFIGALAIMALTAFGVGAPDDFDPNPAAEDLILPMPNGARMVFRPVFLGVGEGVLAEKEYIMGDSSGANMRELPTAVSVGGSFVKENAGRKDWMFYLGKYEVTCAQYQTLGAQKGGSGRTPQTGLTRGEVERFIEAYNTWLRKEAPGALPEQGGSPGFLQMPSEQEWEFAARGGVAVNAERFQKATPYEGELAKHEWFAGQRSSFGKLKEAGLLAPNPLQIYDLLGNAAEMTRSSYTLKFGRGRSGGYTVRGGSFRTAEGEMRASLRTEQLMVGADGQPPKDESVGFRLAIGSAVFANLASSRALEDASADRQAVKTPVPPMKTPAQATPEAKPQEASPATEQQLRAAREEIDRLKSVLASRATPAPSPSPAATPAPPMEVVKLVPPVPQPLKEPPPAASIGLDAVTAFVRTHLKAEERKDWDVVIENFAPTVTIVSLKDGKTIRDVQMGHDGLLKEKRDDADAWPLQQTKITSPIETDSFDGGRFHVQWRQVSRNENQKEQKWNESESEISFTIQSEGSRLNITKVRTVLLQSNKGTLTGTASQSPVASPPIASIGLDAVTAFVRGHLEAEERRNWGIVVEDFAPTVTIVSLKEGKKIRGVQLGRAGVLKEKRDDADAWPSQQTKIISPIEARNLDGGRSYVKWRQVSRNENQQSQKWNENETDITFTIQSIGSQFNITEVRTVVLRSNKGTLTGTVFQPQIVSSPPTSTGIDRLLPKSLPNAPNFLPREMPGKAPPSGSSLRDRTRAFDKL